MLMHGWHLSSARPFPSYGMLAMKLNEVRRIHGEQSARLLWQIGGPDLTIASIDKIIARKETAEAWVRRRQRIFNWILLTLASSQFVCGFFVDWGPDMFGRAILGLVLWAAGWFAMIARYPQEDVDLAFARQLRVDLEQESHRISRLRERAVSKQAYALYLRTFSAETAALTAAEVYRQAEDIRNNVEVDPYDPAVRHLYAARGRIADKLVANLKDEWTLKRQIVATIGAALPVVCLGNINLQKEKRADLAALGVDDATVVTVDWWELFKEVENAAALTFVILDELTVHIGRELDHLRNRGRPFILACSPATDQRLAAEDDYRNLILHPAVRHVVVTENNLAPLQTLLAELL